MKKITTAIIILTMIITMCACSSGDYKKAQNLFENEEYLEAQMIFEGLGDYKDSLEKVSLCKVRECEKLITDLGFFSTYSPSKTKIDEAKQLLEFFQSLTQEEQNQVVNKEKIPLVESIAEAESNLILRQIERKIHEEVVKRIKNGLVNASSFQEINSNFYANWEANDSTRIVGIFSISYSATNTYGGRIDYKNTGSFQGKYIDDEFDIGAIWFLS